MKRLYLWLLPLFMVGFAACSQTENQQIEILPTVTPQTDYHFIGVKTVDSPETRGVALMNKLWHQEATIRIKFLSGTAAQQQEVMRVAQEWLNYADLTFEWNVTGEADVRISIDDNRRISWSSIGTDCKLITDQSKPTMNLAFSALLDESSRHGAILRAFGQMLGLELEHRHIGLVDSWIANLNLIVPALYPDIPWATFKEYIVDPITDTYNITQTQYDPQSIMVWGFPVGFIVLKDGYTAPQGDNRVLSATDKEFIAELYKKTETYVVISPLEYNMAANGGSFRMTVTSNGDWTLSAPSWITPSKTSGSGNDELTVTVAANTGGEPREGRITATTPHDESYCIVKQVAQAFVTVSPATQQIIAAGNTFPLTVNSNTSWNLTAPDWCVLSPSSGTGDATVQVRVLENTTAEVRTGYITPVSNGTNSCTVTQQGESKFSFSPTSLSVGKGIGTYDLQITSNTEWTLSGPAWVTLGSTSGSGNATVRVTVTANTTPDTPRSGNIRATFSTGTANCSIRQAAPVTTYTITNKHPRLFYGPGNFDIPGGWHYPVWSVEIRVTRSIDGATPTYVPCQIQNAQLPFTSCLSASGSTITVTNPDQFMAMPYDYYTGTFTLNYDGRSEQCHVLFEKFYGNFERSMGAAWIGGCLDPQYPDIDL